MDFSNLSKTQISLAGEFSVLSQLSLRGFDANLTLGNAKGVDILVSNPETGNMFKIEVKTSPYKEVTEKLVGEGKFMYWIMQEKHEVIKDPNLYYCMVSINNEGKFRYFIFTSEQIANYVKLQHETYVKTHPHIKKEASLIRKFRVAIEDNEKKYNFDHYTISKSEDNWKILV